MSEPAPRPFRPVEVLRRAKWLLLAALLLRIVLALTLYPDPLGGEEAAFERLGRMLTAGEGFVNEEGMATAYHPVGYPLLISGLYTIFGEHPVAVRLFQALFSTLSLFLLGLFAARAGGVRAMWKALVLGSILPADLFYTTALLPTSFALLLFWLILLLLDPWLNDVPAQYSGRVRWARSSLAGLFAGILTLVQPAMLFLLCLLWALLLWRSHTRRLVLRYALVSLVLSTLLPVAWIVRNDIAVGERALTTGTGVAFWVGNHPLAHGGDRWFDIPLFRPPFERATQRMLIRSTWDGIVDQPWGTLTRLTRKWAWTLRSDQGLMARQVVGYEPDEMTEALHLTPLLLRLFTWFVHVAVFAAGWSAWWFGPRGPWRFWTALLFLYTMAVVTVFYGAPAQHAFLLPPMMLAAVLLPERHEDFKQPTIPMGIGWMVGFLLGMGIWLVEAIQVITL